MNRNKIGAGILLLAVLLTGVVFVASASDDNSQNTLPKGEIFEFNESNSQRVELPDFGPHIMII
ncbi:hypothetical protein EO98_09630 [Methanosarcina sp. 2.H.T.1A.6]|nr:hypothetical protein EO94_16020 [Methanosarcina sp. 2.H.T.1A.3]KKG16046.1 hypothetical protein EO97_12565 [Methanosarcina sp. 2.H.T.1A.15]KKG19710.1 hypothetical protein EO98_09630 [Methanosarcina sp. 2.H.T.1A.6]KKG27097.1 hypothetical protein EO96_09040 [Methanosarcina sp. 2.H.T.1A.8]